MNKDELILLEDYFRSDRFEIKDNEFSCLNMSCTVCNFDLTRHNCKLDGFDVVAFAKKKFPEQLI
jgi:hypothetical protein